MAKNKTVSGIQTVMTGVYTLFMLLLTFIWISLTFLGHLLVCSPRWVEPLGRPLRFGAMLRRGWKWELAVNWSEETSRVEGGGGEERRREWKYSHHLVVVVAVSSLARILGEGPVIPPLRFFFWFFFFFSCFLVETSSRTLIPLFRPGSVHSDSESWDDRGRVS